MSQIDIHFINRGTNDFSRSNPEHAHPFWQMEIGIQGEINLVVEKKTLQLLPDVIFLIPPHVKHSFHYPETIVRWLTLKYQYLLPKDISIDKFRIFDSCPYSDGIRNLIVRSAYDLSIPEEQSTKLLSGLLNVFMDYHFTTLQTKTPPLVRNINSILRQTEGRHIDIRGIADRLNYSAGHIANTYKKVTGNSLKKSIDMERVKVAVGLITHSTMNIGEIARQLEFENIYTFSRFTKNHTGMSPLQLRASNR